MHDPIPRPAQLTAESAAAFQLGGVVENYHLRTPYPPELAPFLLDLMAQRDGSVLELGCGTGEITRMLAPHVERVDAVDISAPMLAKALAMPGGDHPAIRWMHGAAEDAVLDPPYALAFAGDALHWMQWQTVLRRVDDALATGAYCALVSAKTVDEPWTAGLLGPIQRYSMMRDFEPYDFIELLTTHGLLEVTGKQRVGSMRFARTIDEYIGGLHAMSGLASERMGADDTHAFDDAAREVLEPFAVRGVLELCAAADVVWGRAGPSAL